LCSARNVRVPVQQRLPTASTGAHPLPSISFAPDPCLTPAFLGPARLFSNLQHAARLLPPILLPPLQPCPPPGWSAADLLPHKSSTTQSRSCRHGRGWRGLLPRVWTTRGPGVCLSLNTTTPSSPPSWVLGSLPAVASSLPALPIHQCQSLSSHACHLPSSPSIFSHATASTTSSHCTCHPEEHLHQTEANSKSKAATSPAHFHLQLSLQEIHSVPGNPKPCCLPNEAARHTPTKRNEGGNVIWRS